MNIHNLVIVFTLFTNISGNSVRINRRLNCGSQIENYRKYTWSIITNDYYAGTTEGLFFPSGDYCLQKHGRRRNFIVVNNATALNLQTETEKIWNKCCSYDEIIDISTKKCVKTQNIFRPTIQGKLKSFKVGKQSLIPKCTNGQKLQYFSKTSCNKNNKFGIKLTQEGIYHESTVGLFVKNSKWKPLDSEGYCIDGVVDYLSCGLKCEEMRKLNSSIDHTIVFFCQEENEVMKERDSSALSLSIVWLSTCPFLLFSSVTNVLLVQRNVHGWTLSAYLLSMTLLNIFSAVLVLEDKSENGGCRIFDFALKFTYMSTLCWMTAINFGLWRTFGKDNEYLKKAKRGRFIGNFIFSMAVPLIVIISTYFLHQSDICSNEQCVLYSERKFPLFSVVIVCMIVTNLLIFLRTTCMIMKLRHETNAVLQRSSSHLDSFKIFAKLMLMSGPIWILRVVLLLVQYKGFYFTWIGLGLEILFSIPEVAFSLVIVIHPNFVERTWDKFPNAANAVKKVIPCFTPRNLEQQLPLACSLSSKRHQYKPHSLDRKFNSSK